MSNVPAKRKVESELKRGHIKPLSRTLWSTGQVVRGGACEIVGKLTIFGPSDHVIAEDAQLLLDVLSDPKCLEILRLGVATMKAMDQVARSVE